MKFPNGMMGDSPSFPPQVEQDKVSQTNANYQDISPDPSKNCMSCANFVEPDRCLIVAGAINPQGLSDFFTPASENPGDTIGNAAGNPPAMTGPTPNG